MALGMDDKLLGEKVHYYCSSSEDEGEEDNSDTESSGQGNKGQPPPLPPPEIDPYQKSSVNTGPKGVLKDWREFKRLETEQRECQEKEREQLARKLAHTCRSYLDDEKEKKANEEFLQELGELGDEFLQQYREQRLEEMRKRLQNVPKFGKVVSLGSHDFVKAVDEENSRVTIIIHIYEERSQACESMNGCLICLAQEYPAVKFCKIKASDAKLSGHFSVNGVPALLVYKNRDLLGNFVRMSDEFGQDFFATDIESFLQEHGLLPNQEVCVAIRDENTGELRSVLPQDSDDGNDFDID